MTNLLPGLAALSPGVVLMLAGADQAARADALSARLGGAISTNAGGTNVLRYGNARDLVLGLEVVLADGTVWNGLRRLRKETERIQARVDALFDVTEPEDEG